MAETRTKDFSHLVAAAAPGPDALAVVPSTKQLLIGPEVNQVHQPLTTHRAGEAAGMPQGAMVTGALSINSRALLGNIALAPAAALRTERKVKSDLGGNTTLGRPWVTPGRTHIFSRGALEGSIGGAARRRGRAVVGAVFELSLGGCFAQSAALAGQGHLADPQHLLFVALHKEQQGRNLQEVEKRLEDHEDRAGCHRHAAR